MADQLGFSVSCYRGDIPLVRGCLASIRTFAPDAPICLVVDDPSCPTKALERAYDVHVVRVQDVRNPDLRKWSFGWAITKMVAFWEAPFDLVFHVDADAVLWGDVRRNLPPEPWDIVHNEPHEVITDFIQRTQYFDPNRIFDYITPFPWQGNPYFQAGVICVRKGCLDLDEYIRMLELQRRFPEVFVNGDQGILNVMVFRALQAGRLKVKQAHLQTVLPMWEKAELAKQFRIEDGKPVVTGGPTILHWAGPKPWKENKDVFRAPMDYFRAKGMRECGLPGPVPLGVAMSADEFLCRRWPKVVLKCKRAVKRLIGRKT